MYFLLEVPLMANEDPPEPEGNVIIKVDGELQIDPEMFNSIARCAKLLAIQLIESNFNISPGFFDEDLEGKLNLEVTSLNESFDADRRVSTCIFQFENSQKKGRRKVFSLKDTFAVFYKIPIECDEFHALAFVRRTGLLACYPYFRAHAAQTASLANAEMPILPTVASMPIKKKNEKKEKVQ